MVLLSEEVINILLFLVFVKLVLFFYNNFVDVLNNMSELIV